MARLEAWQQEGLAGLHAGLSSRPDADRFSSVSMTPTTERSSSRMIPLFSVLR
jgi:hypothetical protein